MSQLIYTMFISNNQALFHLWWKQNLVKHKKISKCYQNDFRTLVHIIIGQTNKDTMARTWTTVLYWHKYFLAWDFHHTKNSYMIFISFLITLFLENSQQSAFASSRASLHVIVYNLHKIYSHYPAFYTNKDDV